MHVSSFHAFRHSFRFSRLCFSLSFAVSWIETAKYAKTLTVHVFVTYMLPAQQFLYIPRTSHHFYWVRIMFLFPRTRTRFPAAV